MDAAVAGKKPSAGAKNVNDMKAILESLQSVEECGSMEGAMPAPMPEPDPVTMNVSLNARGRDAIEDLIDLMGGAKAPQDAPIRLPMPTPMGPKEPSMADLIKMSSMDDEPEMEEVDDEIEVEGDYANEPDEKYDDHETMIHDLSGGLNREKKQYAKAQDGDNAMAVEDEQATLEQEILKALKADYASRK